MKTTESVFRHEDVNEQTLIDWARNLMNRPLTPDSFPALTFTVVVPGADQRDGSMVTMDRVLDRDLAKRGATRPPAYGGRE